MIGVFDSGLGGLSVLRELKSLMPKQNFIYFADSAHCPYGDKPSDFILERADNITNFLIEKGVDVVVVACNTATAAAISFLRKKYSIPFVGIEPAVKPAASVSLNGKVGVLATANTLNAEKYHQTIERFTDKIKVVERVGLGLVEKVENLELNTPELDLILRDCLAPMLEEEVDTIVLGCTHYPFLKDAIQKIVPENVVLLDPAPAVAVQTRKFISNYDEDGNIDFYTTGDCDQLRNMVILLGTAGNYKYFHP